MSTPPSQPTDPYGQNSSGQDPYGQQPQGQYSAAPQGSAPAGSFGSVPATPAAGSGSGSGRTIGIVCGVLALLAVLLIGGGIALWAMNRGGDEPAPAPTTTEPATTQPATTEPAEESSSAPAESSSAPAESSSAPASESPSAAPAPADGAVKYTLSSSLLTASSTAAIGEGGASVTANGKFLSTQTQVRNTLAEPYQPEPAAFVLVLADGTEVAPVAMKPSGGGDDPAVAPNDTRTYMVYWDVPVDAQAAAVRISIGGETVEAEVTGG